MPEPSSCAPAPTSQESIWPPMTTISSGFSLPGISPMTLAESASAVCSFHFRCTLTTFPASVKRWMSVASSIVTAAAGILGSVACIQARGVRRLYADRHGWIDQCRNSARRAARTAPVCVGDGAPVAFVRDVEQHDLAFNRWRGLSFLIHRSWTRVRLRRDALLRGGNATAQSKNVHRLLTGS